MRDNPYHSSQEHAPQSRASVWKWRFILPLAVLAIFVTADLLAVAGGFSLHNSFGSSVFEDGVAYANIAGIFAVFFFGDLLAHPDDPVHRWNLVIFFIGGALPWVLVSYPVGYVIEYLRS
jgi:hypothetical protein